MASRICPKCGQEAPGTAKFCSQCSSSLIGESTAPMVAPRIEKTGINTAARKSKTLLISTLAISVVVFAAVAVYSLNRLSDSVVRATPPVPIPAPPVVQALPAAPPPAPPVVQAPAQSLPAPPVVQSTTVPEPTAPPEIVAYLAFIQQMEVDRQSLEDSQTAAILPLLTTAQSLKTDADESTKDTGESQIKSAMSANIEKWQDLVKQFSEQTPPAGCEDLANDYYKLLTDYTDLSSQIQVALENGDTAKVMGLQGAQTIVDQDADSADGALLAVCTKYNAKKLFVITPEAGSSGTSLIGG